MTYTSSVVCALYRSRLPDERIKVESGCGRVTMETRHRYLEVLLSTFSSARERTQTDPFRSATSPHHDPNPSSLNNRHYKREPPSRNPPPLYITLTSIPPSLHPPRISLNLYKSTPSTSPDQQLKHTYPVPQHHEDLLPHRPHIPPHARPRHRHPHQRRRKPLTLPISPQAIH